MHYFLDIDGVLNKKSDWSKRYYINPACLSAFKKLLSYDSNPAVVLSSTWRIGVSKSSSFSSDSDLLSVIEKEGVHISDTTPYAPGKTRLEEIDYYVRRHGIKKFVTLDDDESLFPERGSFPLYLVNFRTGLTDKDVEKIRRKYL